MNPITKSVVLACERERAFSLFADHISDWWPPERKHIHGVDSVLVLTPDRFCERARDGSREVILGRVLVWSPPARIEMDFYPGTDEQHPTHVVVTFAIEGDGTRVSILHTPTAASLDLWEQRAPRYVQSWDLVLPALVRAAAT